MAWEVVVNGEHGYFHCWEQYSKPIEPSPMIGGHPGGVVSYTIGIVEFENGISRIDPTLIKFCDEENAMLSVFNKRNGIDEFKERLIEAEKKEKELCPTCKYDNSGRYSSMCSWCDNFNCYQKKGE